MAKSNKEIAEVFNNIADMLEIKGEKIFRVLSYRRAGETLADLPRDLTAYAEEGTLEELPGIGKAIAEKIRELLETGELQFYERLKQEVPMGVLGIMRLNGVGPKRAKLFWEELDITSVEQLEKAARAGQLASLPRMGEKSQQRILDSIEALSRQSGRFLLGNAKPAAERILARLLDVPGVIEGIVAGSIRRGRPTIGDVDILIASEDPEPVMERFVNTEDTARVLGHGTSKSSIELQSGLQVDVRVLSKKRWGTALQYFTGSQAHNVKIREIALANGYSLNEHALRPVDENGELRPEAEYVYCEREEEVYEAVGLPWIPPELREDSGEIEAAKQGKLPDLITAEDIVADLHMHTTYSDGKMSIRDMAQAARERGLQYIVITDHSRSSAVAGGLSVERLMEQQQEVRQIDAEMGDDFHVLHGVEMDIKSDATLDYPDEVLARLDVVIASLHFALQQDQEQITQRLLTAIQNPHVDIIGHPTGRLIDSREPAQVDMDRVFQAALEHQTALEINSNPRRLDLDAQYVRRAMDVGVLLSINTDAHSTQMLTNIEYGLLTARRGWATAASVVNTWPIARFREWLAR